MHSRFRALLLLLGLSFASLSTQAQSGQIVRFRTNLGDIDVEMLSSVAPNTVANFLTYVNSGAYRNTLFHRSVRTFVIQGGGFRLDGTRFVSINQGAAINNEYRTSNTRGTIAMAKLDGNPNSATNQWFFNLSDNSSQLDRTNGGFTVFGRITNDAGLAIMDRIAEVPVPFPHPFAAPYNEMPLQNYTGGSVSQSMLILCSGIYVLGAPPRIADNGILSATNFGGYNYAAPGSYIEIYGSNLAGESARGWATADFRNNTAPTTLDEVSVTINGQPAFVNFVSRGQINVQVPATATLSGDVPVVVSYLGQPSQTMMLRMRGLAPGLLAPASFRVDDRQYVVALRANSTTFISNGNIPNVPAAPAAPGETITLYGSGFGAVTPGSAAIAGVIASGTSAIAATLRVRIGGQDAALSYAGLAPGLVGVYQFNVVVPANAPSGDQRLEMTVDGEALPQTLYLPIR
jgi:peptidyl-prolyl cis-trans isomerase A (cyclophilin A)